MNLYLRSLLFLSVTIVGCSQINDAPNADVVTNGGLSLQTQANVDQEEQSLKTIKVANRTDVNYYVRGLMYKLLDNIYGVTDETPMAVTSFVNTDSNFQNTNILGNQIAESFIHEAHNSGLSVVDFKTTDYIRVTQNGDFVFSRDYRELGESAPIIYVLSGTMTQDNAGYLINARIIEIQTKVVAATAQSHIPQFIVDEIEKETETGIRLQ